MSLLHHLCEGQGGIRIICVCAMGADGTVVVSELGGAIYLGARISCE